MNTDINVLVVDDIEQNLIAMEALIARPGLKVLKAASGQQALEILLATEVALALLDVQMPEMDGFELAELIRGSSRTHDIPLIFLTAAARDPRRTFRGYEAGAVDFLHKPIDTHVLKSKVEAFVELHAQRRQLSEQLEQLKQALHLNEMFMAVLGHDLRNPLAAMLNYTEVIHRTAGEPAVREAAERIRASGRRMTGMIDQMLDLARIRSGALKLNLAKADVHGLCCDIRQEFERPDAPSRIELRRHGDTQASFDADLIGQVLSNLLGNALHHGDGAVAVTVTIDGGRDDRILVSVHNGGVIPPALLDGIFEPFRTRRADNARGGLGLGLYIVRQFVEAHGGSVDVRSTPAEGTTFRVSLPRHPARVPRRPDGAPAAASQGLEAAR